MKNSTTLTAKLRTRLRKLRKQPKVTSEQKLQCKIDTLNTQAQDLHTQCTSLREQTATFGTRAQNTPKPASPPPEREPLFQRDRPTQYDAQVKAFGILQRDWRAHEKAVQGFGEELEAFGVRVEGLKGSGKKKGKGKAELQYGFEGLENAVMNLKEQRVELSKEMAAAGLPVAK